MLMHPFLFAPLFSAVFLLLQEAEGVPSAVNDGLIYGVSVFCIRSLPVFLIVFASLQVPSNVIAAWIIQNLVQYLVAGFALASVARNIAASQSI